MEQPACCIKGHSRLCEVIIIPYPRTAVKSIIVAVIVVMISAEAAARMGTAIAAS